MTGPAPYSNDALLGIAISLMLLVISNFIFNYKKDHDKYNQLSGNRSKRKRL